MKTKKKLERGDQAQTWLEAKLQRLINPPGEPVRLTNTQLDKVGAMLNKNRAWTLHSTRELLKFLSYEPKDWNTCELSLIARGLEALALETKTVKDSDFVAYHAPGTAIEPAKEWMVRLSTEQLSLLQHASEFAARVQAGQLEEVERWYANQASENSPKQFRLPPPEAGISQTVGAGTERDREFSRKCERRHEFARWLRRLEEEYGLRENHHTPLGQQLWYLYTKIRHDLAWDRHPEGDWGVQFDEPMGLGGFKEPLKIWRADRPEPTDEQMAEARLTKSRRRVEQAPAFKRGKKNDNQESDDSGTGD